MTPRHSPVVGSWSAVASLGPGWPDARGWIAIASFLLTVFVLVLIWQVPDLRKDEFFKNITVLIVGTGWINGALTWAFSATKNGGDLAMRNADLLEQQARAPTGRADDPLSVTEDGKGKGQ